MQTQILEEQLKSLFEISNYKENSPLYEIILRGYVYSKIENHKKVLFVGINPSYINGAKPYDHTSYEIQDVVKLYPKHYKKFQNMADNCGFGADWTYLDMFYFRETNQNTIDSILNETNGVDFLVNQLQITFTQLEALKPDLIIVCNSGARKFFGIDKQPNNENAVSDIWLGYDFVFDEKFGVDLITGLNEKAIHKDVKKRNLVGTPVLFSSTLTYMDSSTRKSLEWQIKTILKFKNVFFDKNNFNEPRSSKLFIQLKELTSKLQESKNLKTKLLSENKYEELSKLRDIELNDLEEIVELLLHLEK